MEREEIAAIIQLLKDVYSSVPTSAHEYSEKHHNVIDKLKKLSYILYLNGNINTDICNTITLKHRGEYCNIVERLAKTHSFSMDKSIDIRNQVSKLIYLLSESVVKKKETNMPKKPPTFDTPFDTYTASATIGEGGAGRVYLVRNSAGEEYALKCLSHERITTERLKRFKNEIQFCQRHIHPNIIKVVDSGMAIIKEVKCPFYVMNCYAGTLRTQMSKIKPDSIMPFFSQIMDGVEAAHLMAVWHRDLKPENVLFDQRENRLLVADFGIAHFEEEEIYTAVETKVSARMANFQYSAPEQRARNAKVDHKADIFALGLILNELFTGEIIQGTGYKKIADIDPNYSYLDDLVGLMTQQDPANRPNSINAIKMELMGRKNAFVALQKYDETRKQVVNTAEPPVFEPIQIVDFDYESGNLILTFSRSVNDGWVQEFQQQRGGHSAILGYEPERFNIRRDKASLGVRGDEGLIQEILNHAKNYVNAANRNFELQLQAHARKEEQQQRAALEKQVEEAERRKNILSKVTL